MKKVVLWAFAFFVFILVASAAFNHINAYAGIILVFGGVYFIASKVSNFLKEKELSLTNSKDSNDA